MDIELHYTRRYLKRGKKAHLINVSNLADPNVQAACGMWAWELEWMGSGSFAEAEKAKELTLCAVCDRMTKGL